MVARKGENVGAGGGLNSRTETGKETRARRMGYLWLILIPCGICVIVARVKVNVMISDSVGDISLVEVIVRETNMSTRIPIPGGHIGESIGRLSVFLQNQTEHEGDITITSVPITMSKQKQ